MLGGCALKTRRNIPGLQRTGAISRAGGSRVHVPAFDRLVVLRIRGTGFADRHDPRQDHHRENEQKRSPGHLAEHCPVSLIFLEDSRGTAPGQAILNFWLTRGRASCAGVGFAAFQSSSTWSLQWPALLLLSPTACFRRSISRRRRWRGSIRLIACRKAAMPTTSWR